MNDKERQRLEQECYKLLLPMLSKEVTIPSGMRPVVKISISFEVVPIDPLVRIHNGTRVRWEKSNQPFTDEEFKEILALPLGTEDRKFVELCRKRKNKPITVKEWCDLGFAEKGRIASINEICRTHGLMLGFRTTDRVRVGGLPWPDWPHQFFVLEEKESRE